MAMRLRPLNSVGAEWFHWQRRSFARTPSGGMLIRDPLAKWGATGTMGTRELLDSIDRAQRAKILGRNRALTERLSCRAQALAPDFSAAELCRALFSFHRARCRDQDLLQAACDSIAEDSWQSYSGNDVAMLMKALSKHGFKDLPTVDRLLMRASDLVEELTAADIAQLLSAVVRLDVAEHVGSGGRHELLLPQLLNSVLRQLTDAYLPPSDLTNLCVVCALCEPCIESSRLLEAVALRLGGSGAASTPPRDIVRRLLSVRAFDERVQSTPSAEDGITVHTRLGPDGRLRICRAAAASLSRRAPELDLESTVGACEALAYLLPSHAKEGCAIELGPLLAQVLQRLPALPVELLLRMARAIPSLARSEALGEARSVIQELIVSMPHELRRKQGTLGSAAEAELSQLTESVAFTSIADRPSSKAKTSGE